jgi:hypothetical protein
MAILDDDAAKVVKLLPANMLPVFVAMTGDVKRFVPVNTFVPLRRETLVELGAVSVKLLIPLVTTTTVELPAMMRVGGRPGDTAAMVSDTSSPSRR